MGEEPNMKVEQASSMIPLLVNNISSTKPPPKVAEIDDVTKSSGDSNDRVVAFARIETEKRLALIKAWEESEKSKAENRAYKKLSAVDAWESTKRAALEAQLKQIEEEIEKEKAAYVQKMKNKMAEIHRSADEKRAVIEAKRGEDIVKVEEISDKFRETGTIPKRLFGCFGC